MGTFFRNRLDAPSHREGEPPLYRFTRSFEKHFECFVSPGEVALVRQRQMLEVSGIVFRKHPVLYCTVYLIKYMCRPLD